MPRTIVITPAAPVLTADDVRQHRAGIPDPDEFLKGLVAAATASIDNLRGYWRLSIGPRLLETRFDGFGDLGAALTLPFGPVLRVVSVAYLDANGVQQTAAVPTYDVVGDDVQAAFGSDWPACRDGRETVRVRYWAGFSADPTADPPVAALPFDIRAALLLIVGDLYSNRETTVDARAAAAVPIPMVPTVDNLLGPYRSWL